MTRKTKSWLRFAVGVAVSVGALVVVMRGMASSDKAALQEQLRLAWAEGLPTNAEQMASTITPAKSSENAAPIYQSMGRAYSESGPDAIDPIKTEWMLLNQPNPATLKAAEDALGRVKTTLSLLDRATRLRRCWFNRDWTTAFIKANPALYEMKKAARLLALRGAVEISEGHDDMALSNVQQIFQLGKHAADEGSRYNAWESYGIYFSGVRELTNWAFAKPGDSKLTAALHVAIEKMPLPDAAASNREQLFLALTCIELTKTEGGRRALGFRPEDGPPIEKRAYAAILSQPKALVQLVQAERAYWKALKLTGAKRRKAIDSASIIFDGAIPAFPYVFTDTQDAGSFHEDPEELENYFEAFRQSYTAAWRALIAGGRVNTIKVDDLKSPYNGDPIHYEFDGKQIKIWVNDKYRTHANLTIPPVKPGP